MAKVRGLVLVNTVQFIKETFGPEAHDKVLAALPPGPRATYAGPIRDAAWEDLDDLSEYAEAAKRLLAPGDPDFHRRVGAFSGRKARDEGGFLPMVADPSTAMRLGPVLWRSFSDTGRFEFVTTGPKEGFARIRDFPTTRALCERICGSWERLLGGPQNPAHLEKSACVLDGSAYCEFRVRWE